MVKFGTRRLELDHELSIRQLCTCLTNIQLAYLLVVIVVVVVVLVLVEVVGCT